MRSFLRNHLRGLAVGIAACLAFASAAFALTIPPTFAPRMFQTQQVHYFRINVSLGSINGQGCVLVSGACSIKVGALPYNAFIKQVTVYPVTTFNSTTSDTIALGIGNGSGLTNDIMTAQSIHTAATSSVFTTTLGGFGLAVTGNSATSTGANGGFDLWVTYSQVGTAATQGQAIILLDYAAPNDGTCTQVPLGSTAAAC